MLKKIWNLSTLWLEVNKDEQKQVKQFPIKYSHQESIRSDGWLKVQEAAFWPKDCKLESLIHSCSTGAVQQHQQHERTV